MTGESGRGRHQLSSVDLLPEEAHGIVGWALAELAKGERTDSDILFEFNDQLAAIGVEPISKSAFGRYALAKRKMTMALAAMTKAGEALDALSTADKADAATRVIVQMIKAAIYEQSLRGSLKPKELAEMGRALNYALQAQRVSLGEAEKVRSRDKTLKAAEHAVEALKSEHPNLDGARILAAIRDAYGIAEGG